MEWQPIDTAPKDGRYIIVGRFRNGDEFCWAKHSRWMTADEAADIEECDPEDCEAGWTNGNDEEDLCYPTHWMPLPPPPVQP